MDDYIDGLLDDQERVPFNYDTFVATFRPLGSKVHVSFLFEDRGRKVLKHIRRKFLSNLTEDELNASWRAFAVALGYKELLLQCIENDLAGKDNKEPIWWVLLGYTMFEGSTLDKISDALKLLERDDILREIMEDLWELAKSVISSKSSLDEDGAIFTYHCVPEMPDLLKIGLKIFFSTNELCNGRIDREESIANVTRGDETSRKKVIFTFANDGLEIAQWAAEKFNAGGIDIINLGKDRPYLWSTSQFVDDCIEKVNYVIAILTQGYLDVTIKPCVTEVRPSVDQQYARHIHCSLLKKYHDKGCINEKMRCIVSDKDAAAFEQIEVSPILDLQFSESHIGTLIDRIRRNEI